MEAGYRHTHVKLVGAFTHEHYALPGVGCAPDFAIPVRAFLPDKIVGQHLCVVDSFTGEIRRDERDGKPVLTEKVSGYVDRNNKSRRYGLLNEIAQADGSVHVMFGPTPVVEEFEERPTADVSEISTPPTPDPLRC